MFATALLVASALSATVSAATCVSSAAAAATANSTFTLPDYTEAAAPVSGAAYDVTVSFQATYAFNSTMVNGLCV